MKKFINIFLKNIILIIFLILVIFGCKTLKPGSGDDGTSLYSDNFVTNFDDGTNASVLVEVKNNRSNIEKFKKSQKKSKTIYKKYIPEKEVKKLKHSKGTVKFLYPVNKIDIISQKNNVINFKTTSSTAIKPIAPGMVIFAGHKQTFGNTLFIYHDKDFISIYYHLKKIFVNKGEYIKNLNKKIANCQDYFQFKIVKSVSSGLLDVDSFKFLIKRK